jgi:hypothetical protein
MDRKEFEQQRNRQASGMRTIYHFVMGILWVGLGIFFLNHKRFGLEGSFDPGLATLFGAICVGYGLFRAWRGYKSRSVN